MWDFAYTANIMENIINHIRGLRKSQRQSQANSGAELRAVSARIITDVLLKQKKLSLVLKDYNEQNPNLNWSWIKQVCFGTFRYYHQLQWLSDYLIPKPIARKHTDIQALILIGLYQLEYMQTPDHASVNETVAATKLLNKTWAKGLCNKVLRRFRKQHDTIVQQFQDNPSILYSHPQWLVDAISTAWPSQWQTILSNNNQQAPLFLRVNPQQIDRDRFIEQLKQQGITAEKVGDVSNVRLTQALPVEDIPGFNEGLFSVQDQSGQQIIPLLDLHAGHSVLDACAAPGSKTCHILEQEHSLNKLVAVDINADRLIHIKDNIMRLKLSAHTLRLTLADATHSKEWWDGEPFDRILLDAPCSATGVIRRHPDIKTLRKAEDITETCQLQQYLLRSLWPLLAPGGRLLYTTCSILPEENDHIIKQFTKKNKDAKTQIPEVQNGISMKYGCQVLPENQGGDGFYYCILSKQNLSQ